MSTPGADPFSGQILPPSKKYIHWPDVALAAGAAGAAAWWVTGWTMWTDLPILGPVPQDDWTFHAGYWLRLGAHLISPHFFSGAYSEYHAWLGQFYGHGWGIVARQWLAAIGWLAGGAGAGWWAATPRTGERTTRGGDLLAGKEATHAARKTAAVQRAKGIEIAPGCRLTFTQETEHLMIVGGTGSGKSVAAWRIVTQAQERGDRILLFDFKGFTEKIPGDPLIICPWDQRSAVWDIARDVRTRAEARDFAARMILEAHDPMWSNAARGVLAGCVIALQRTKGDRWTWCDLADILVSPRDTIAGLLAQHFPEGLRSIEQAGKTAQSVLINLGAYMASLFDIALAWGDDEYRTRELFSFRAWAQDTEHRRRSVIVRTSSAFAELSAALAPAIVGQLAAQISDLPDVAPDHSRLWIVADEFPKLGKIADWGTFLDVGRSKSVRIVTAVQTVSQIKKLYGPEMMDSWISLVGTSIFGRSRGATARWISQEIGERHFERQSYSQNYGGQGGSSSSMTWQRDKADHILPGEVGTKLGTLERLTGRPAGVRMLFSGIGDDPLIMDLPFQQLPKIREQEIRAPWALPGETAADRHEFLADSRPPEYAGGALGGIMDSATEVESEDTQERPPEESHLHHVEPDFASATPVPAPEPEIEDPFEKLASGTQIPEPAHVVIEIAEVAEHLAPAPGPAVPVRTFRERVAERKCVQTEEEREC